MGAFSHIEWTDHTFNPWIGCTKVSPGCAHCYAEHLMDTRLGRVVWGKGHPRVRTSAANWDQVRRWNRAAREAFTAALSAGKFLPPRPRVFCASLADWLDDEVPIEWLRDLLQLIRDTQYLDWQLLTKRPQNWKTRLDDVCRFEPMAEEEDPRQTLTDWIINWYNDEPPANVWIGTSVEDQTRANERIPLLRTIPAAVRFLSMEPLLGAVTLFNASTIGAEANNSDSRLAGEPWIDWVIVGGESGKDARPMNPDWVRRLRDECGASSVPFFFKQWGEWVRDADITVKACPEESRLVEFGDGDPTNFRRVYRVGKKAAGRALDKREWNEMPR